MKIEFILRDEFILLTKFISKFLIHQSVIYSKRVGHLEIFKTRILSIFPLFTTKNSGKQWKCHDLGKISKLFESVQPSTLSTIYPSKIKVKCFNFTRSSFSQKFNQFCHFNEKHCKKYRSLRYVIYIRPLIMKNSTFQF